MNTWFKGVNAEYDRLLQLRDKISKNKASIYPGNEIVKWVYLKTQLKV